MTDTAAALGSLGSDLAFSVSFGIGRELLDAAHEAQMSEDELIAAVLTVSIVMTAAPRTFIAITKELRDCRRARKALVRVAPDANANEAKDRRATATESGLIAFFGLLVDIAKRIAISLSVQLLAANVRAKQVTRSVRIVSLLSVAIFFCTSPTPCANASCVLTALPSVLAVFLEASSSIGLKVRKQ